ncbi:hypothetical protein [Bacillus sp. AFS023182]|uniref:hypothetical protein n=1 Tax=Bacillus sp. AFS023182 TaxID=2033492 RepID=UPI001145B364|nr:hypothetical protein [Bacillus sp. AFS023182]
MKQMFKRSLYTFICLTFLSACSSTPSIVGTWKLTEESSCDKEAKIIFTKEGTVQWVDGAGTIAGKYEKNTDNVYTFNLNERTFTATLDKKQTTFEVGGTNIKGNCTFKKQKE